VGLLVSALSAVAVDPTASRATGRVSAVAVDYRLLLIGTACLMLTTGSFASHRSVQRTPSMPDLPQEPRDDRSPPPSAAAVSTVALHP